MGQPIHMRVGGFGGVEGLVAYLQAEKITHVIDATHPFAAQMSTNAVAACTTTGTPLIALERAPWTPAEGDNWTRVPTFPAAVAALSGPPKRVFLAIGRQHLDPSPPNRSTATCCASSTRRPARCRCRWPMWCRPRAVSCGQRHRPSAGPRNRSRRRQERRRQGRGRQDRCRPRAGSAGPDDRPPDDPRPPVARTVAEVMAWLHP
jgi:hypothetical protein